MPCTTLIQCDGPSPYLPSSPSRPYQALGETKRPQEERELRDSSESGVVAASGSGSIGSHTSHTVRASACANVFLLYSDCRAASSRGAPSISLGRYRMVDGPIGGTVSGLALPPTPVRVTVAAPLQCVAARRAQRERVSLGVPSRLLLSLSLNKPTKDLLLFVIASDHIFEFRHTTARARGYSLRSRGA